MIRYYHFTHWYNLEGMHNAVHFYVMNQSCVLTAKKSDGQLKCWSQVEDIVTVRPSLLCLWLEYIIIIIIIIMEFIYIAHVQLQQEPQAHYNGSN